MTTHYHDTDSAETGWCSGCGRRDLAVGCLTCGDHGCGDCEPTLFRPSRRDDGGFHPQEECPSCGYVLELHTTPRSDLGGWPDRNGGCPESEVQAAMRWGWM